MLTYFFTIDQLSLMTLDPRSRNKIFNKSNITSYLLDYLDELNYGLVQLNKEELEKAFRLLELTTARSGRIFVGGNGGSAAISDHLCCDFVKGTYSEKKNGLVVHSLVGSQSLFTAIGNDFGYEHTLSFQLEAQKINNKDLLILISSSGNSPNIIKAATTARAVRAPVIGLTGFSGGDLLKLSDAKLHVPINNYGAIEDAHQLIMHNLAQFYYASYNE